jgi:hypothetical protein
VQTFLVGLVSAVIGAFITTRVQRFHATWLKRRDTAAEAYTATVRVHSVVTSSLILARRVDAEMRKTTRCQEVAESADWNIRGQLDASRKRLEELRDARLNVRSIWGSEIAELFDAFFDLAIAWQNAFAEFGDAIHGYVTGDEWSWDIDNTGYNWESVISGIEPDASAFEAEIERQLSWIRRFARSAGVVASDILGLPWGAQEVVTEFHEERERRRVHADLRHVLHPRAAAGLRTSRSAPRSSTSTPYAIAKSA